MGEEGRKAAAKAKVSERRASAAQSPDDGQEVFRPRSNVSRAQAAAEIAEYVNRCPGSDALDICEELRLPLPLVEEIAEELVRKGLLRKRD